MQNGVSLMANPAVVFLSGSLSASLNLQHLIGEYACSRLHFHIVAHLAADQRLAHRTLVGYPALQAVSLCGAHDFVLQLLAVLNVKKPYHTADIDFVQVHLIFNHYLGVLQNLLQFLDSGLDIALLKRLLIYKIVLIIR